MRRVEGLDYHGNDLPADTSLIPNQPFPSRNRASSSSSQLYWMNLDEGAGPGGPSTCVQYTSNFCAELRAGRSLGPWRLKRSLTVP